MERDFRLNVWDFGGQEIYKTTHQFFLTRRAIYLFVVEARKHEDTSTDIFYYWFNTVQLLGGNSPLLVVQNKSDLPAVYLPMSDYYRDFENIEHGEERASCQDGEEASIERLRTRVVQIVQNLYQAGKLGMELPSTWVRIRRAIAEVDKDYIPIQTYYDICASHGLDESVADVISRVFHELGAFLHFQDELRLQDTLFLNHEWVTDAVYRVLDNQTIIKNQGRFSPQDLRTIWSEATYRRMQQKLIDLMCKFELAYELLNGDYLTPQLLPGDFPQEKIPWRSEQNNLFFVYAYDFMPRGILSRLIVRLHQIIYQEVRWYSGVLFDWGSTRALVREERARNRIVIRLEGSDRRGLLAIVRQQVEEIHATFGSKLQVHEKVPCSCESCARLSEPHFYLFKSLQSRLEVGRYEIDCENSPHHRVNIQQLLAAVRMPEAERYADETLDEYGEIITGKRLLPQRGPMNRLPAAPTALTEASLDLELEIKCSHEAGNYRLTFTLRSGSHIQSHGGYHNTMVGEIQLHGTPSQKLQGIYQELNHMAPDKPNKAEEEQAYDQRSLDAMGRRLWDELIPEGLQNRYWTFREEVSSLLITSDEPWIPWEMVKPYRFQNGERQEDPFWCQQLDLARWLPGPSPIKALPAGQVHPIAQESSRLTFVPKELEVLQGFSISHPAMDVQPTLGNQSAVLDAIEQEHFALMHFACHGTVNASDINNSEIELTNGTIRPQDLLAQFGGSRTRPLIFLNTCNGARSDFSFTGLGGWAERFIQSAHVGAFVGALWEVDDRLALLFMETFYNQLIQEGMPIAQAFRSAREAVRNEQPWNSTWLAYVLYAHPLARVEDDKMRG
ncbi:MAG: COR domain-containing protein [Chloroflexota bacterium]